MTIATSLGTLGSFVLYFVAAIGLTAVFAFVYTWLTPWNEFALMRASNNAALLSFSGALLGFILPLASVIVHSHSIVDMLVWGVVALIVQVLVFVVERLLDTDLKRRIEAGETAAGGKLGVLALGAGILNAACMSY